MSDAPLSAPAPASRYLRPLRPAKDPALSGRLARRWCLVAFIGGMLGSLAYGTRARWFSFDGPGYVVYWLHDTAYLPLKGHLWTAWLPLSLVPWTVAALLLGIALAGYLSGRPLLRAAHMKATRFALASPTGRKILDRWHAVVARTRFRARHLELVLEEERADLLDLIDGAENGLPTGTLVTRLAALARLSAAWQLRCGGGDAVRMSVSADLLETILRIDVAASAPESHWPSGSESSSGGMAAAPVRAAISDLAAVLEAHLATCADQPADDPFAPAALAGEAGILVRTLTARIALGRSAEADLLRPVAAAVMERCNRLNSIRAAAERRLRGHGNDALVPEASLPASGRLALWIALSAAREAEAPDLAQATLDSLSGLDFARTLGLPSPARLFADIWLAEAPDLPHWRMAAQVIGAAQSAVPDGDSLADPADREHLNEPMHRLAWAAGTPETTR